MDMDAALQYGYSPRSAATDRNRMSAQREPNAWVYFKFEILSELYHSSLNNSSRVSIRIHDLSKRII